MIYGFSKKEKDDSKTKVNSIEKGTIIACRRMTTTHKSKYCEHFQTSASLMIIWEFEDKSA